jgi:hypothetical protein
MLTWPVFSDVFPEILRPQSARNIDIEFDGPSRKLFQFSRNRSPTSNLSSRILVEAHLQSIVRGQRDKGIADMSYASQMPDALVYLLG